jgi:hypothetical protein
VRERVTEATLGGERAKEGTKDPAHLVARWLISTGTYTAGGALAGAAAAASLSDMAAGSAENCAGPQM